MPETGSVRAPRAFLNGIVLLEVEVHLVRLGQASTFEAVMALDDPSNPGAAFWSDVGESGATITIDGVTVFSGHFTHTEVNFGPRVVRAEGKDSADTMIGTRTDEAFPNQTVGSVVSKLAGKVGLGTVQGGKSGDMAGHTYDYQEYRYNTDVQSAWDAVQDMANQIGNIAFVDGVAKTLYFVEPNFTEGNFNVVYRNPTTESYDESNVAVELLCGHDCTLQGGSSTLADSMFSFDNKTYVGKSGGGGTGGGTKEFYSEEPGRTQDQVQTKAKGLKNLADSKQWTIEVLAPGDPSVKASTGVTLSGTGTAWDQLYAVQSVTHRVSAEHGYLMEITGNAGMGGSGG